MNTCATRQGNGENNRIPLSPLIAPEIERILVAFFNLPYACFTIETFNNRWTVLKVPPIENKPRVHCSLEVWYLIGLLKSDTGGCFVIEN
jgi:hypothetical protein